MEDVDSCVAVLEELVMVWVAWEEELFGVAVDRVDVLPGRPIDATEAEPPKTQPGPNGI